MSSRAYEDTRVPVEQSKGAIRLLFKKYDVQGFRFTEDWRQHTVGIEFMRIELGPPEGKAGKRAEIPIGIRMVIPVAEGRYSREDYSQAAWERRERQVWRALYFHLKSQLEAIAFGLRTLTDAFMAEIIMQDGRTMGDHVKSALLSGRLALPAGLEESLRVP